MSGRRHHWLTRLYPPSWQRRYGDEMDELLRQGCGWREALDVGKAALVERLFYFEKAGAKMMRSYPGDFAILVRKPSAIAPIIMSVLALAVVLIAIATTDVKRQSDEGAAAHMWQLLMAGQLPVLGWFALRWLTRDLRVALPIVALQILSFGAALLPVWLLRL